MALGMQINSLKYSDWHYGKVNKSADVEFLVSLTATSLQIVMQSEMYIGAMPQNNLLFQLRSSIVAA